MATEGVYDYKEIEEARVGQHVGDFDYPQHAPDLSGEVHVDQIRPILPSTDRKVVCTALLATGD